MIEAVNLLKSSKVTYVQDVAREAAKALAQRAEASAVTVLRFASVFCLLAPHAS